MESSEMAANVHLCDTGAMEKTRRAAKAKPPAAPREAAPAAQREPRGARRKRETRDKLLRAAFRLMAQRGIDAVAINEITEAADVGFGSFYAVSAPDY
jgi:AcrR family transcriptional regulator